MKELTPERWRELSPHLDRALELSESERPAHLADLRRRDAALAAELEALLEERRGASRDGFLEDTPGSGPPQPDAALAGQSFGPYTLETLIGQGGMGNVWLAHRSDGRFEGKVAVKLLNASRLGHAGEERFRREGQVLARLADPHIARLIDAGVSASGQPYLVLEYVEGEPIDRFCDQHQLGVEARLRLFLEVLAAIAHAHANLIVHRDIKPSNVLVDLNGRVRLLDFGIAKLLEGEGEGGVVTALTREGGRALTPEYAAPEQITDGAVTTATDVYAIGVLLYLLLTGRHPAGAALHSPAELVRWITEAEPERPSESVAERRNEDPEERRRCAAARGTTTEGLQRALRGDLDTIVRKCLKKQPAERYASVTALAEDLRRYLRSEPIGARPDTWAYRVGKFVRRNRFGVAAAAIVFLALAGGFAATAWQAREVARQRDFALTQLRRSRGVNEFTAYLLGEAVPGGRAVTMRELLQRGEQLVDKRFAQDPALAVDLLVVIGDVYTILEETDNSERTMKRAYDTSLTLHDPVVRANAACGWARTVALSGDYARAKRFIAEGLAQTTEDARFDDIAAGCLVDRGEIATSEGDPEVAIDSARMALRRLEAAPGAFATERADALHLLALGYDMRGESASANDAFGRAMHQLEQLGLGDSTSAATLLNNWALTRATTDTLGALELQTRALAALQGAGAAEAVPAAFWANDGRLLNRLGRYAEARSVYERAREDARRHESLRTVGTANLGLARACRELDDRDCARAALRDAEVALNASFPPGHFFFADLGHERAMLTAIEGNPDEARRMLGEALALHEKVSEKHVSHIETLLDLSRLELGAGRWSEAEAHARRASALAEGFRGGMARSAWVGLALVARGEIALAQGQDREARRLFAEAIPQMETTLGPLHPACRSARDRMSRLPG